MEKDKEEAKKVVKEEVKQDSSSKPADNEISDKDLNEASGGRYAQRDGTRGKKPNH